MGANLTKMFVIDVEATCWADDDVSTEWRPNEVIEIGVAVLNLKTRNIDHKESIVVRPRFTKVSEFCTQLTGWTQEEIDQGMDIEDALVLFQNRFEPTGNHIWASYGEYDRYKLSSLTGLPGLFNLYDIQAEYNPFDKMRSHLNIKTLMALKYSLKRELGLARALDHFNMKFEGRHHNGADDAYNIAKITSMVLS